MQNYSLLIYFQKSATNSKIVFPLHEGENIIGANKGSDIYLNLPENEIDPIHAKITVNKQKYLLDIGIKIIKSTKAYIEKEDNHKILVPGKEYELPKNSIFYLNDYTKFTLIKGTIDEIRTIFIFENIEKQFLKWFNKIINDKKESKINMTKYNNNDSISKNGKETNNNHIAHKEYLPEYKVFKKDYFPILKTKNTLCEDIIKNTSSQFLTESFSTSFSSNKFNKNSNNLNACTTNLLNLFNLNIDEDKIENICQERRDMIRELLGENGLDDIINCTNYHKIKKYDKLYYSNLRNKKYISYKH